MSVKQLAEGDESTLGMSHTAWPPARMSPVFPRYGERLPRLALCRRSRIRLLTAGPLICAARWGSPSNEHLALHADWERAVRFITAVPVRPAQGAFRTPVCGSDGVGKLHPGHAMSAKSRERENRRAPLLVANVRSASGLGENTSVRRTCPDCWPDLRTDWYKSGDPAVTGESCSRGLGNRCASLACSARAGSRRADTVKLGS